MYYLNILVFWHVDTGKNWVVTDLVCPGHFLRCEIDTNIAFVGECDGPCCIPNGRRHIF